MTTAEQLRQLHITILKAIDQAELILSDNPQFQDPDSWQHGYTEKIVQDLEAVIFNPLYNIKDYLDIEYAPIEKDDML